MSETQTGGSFRPSKQQKLLAIDDVDILVVQARIVPWDYGKGGEKGFNTFVRLVLAIEGFDDLRTEYYSLGKDTIIAPSLDGKTALPTRGPDGKLAQPQPEGFFFVGVKKPIEGVPEGSVAGSLFADMVNSGFNEEDMTSDVRFVEGHKFHAVQKKSKSQGGDDKSHLMPNKYLGKGNVAGITVPAPAASGAAPATAPTAAAPQAAAQPSASLAVLQDLLVTAIAEGGGSITKAQAVSYVSANSPADQKQALLQLLLQESTLKAGPFKYDAASKSLSL